MTIWLLSLPARTEGRQLFFNGSCRHGDAAIHSADSAKSASDRPGGAADRGSTLDPGVGPEQSRTSAQIRCSARHRVADPGIGDMALRSRKRSNTAEQILVGRDSNTSQIDAAGGGIPESLPAAPGVIIGMNATTDVLSFPGTVRQPVRRRDQYEPGQRRRGVRDVVASSVSRSVLGRDRRGDRRVICAFRDDEPRPWHSRRPAIPPRRARWPGSSRGTAPSVCG